MATFAVTFSYPDGRFELFVQDGSVCYFEMECGYKLVISGVDGDNSMTFPDGKEISLTLDDDTTDLTEEMIAELKSDNVRFRELCPETDRFLSLIDCNPYPIIDLARTSRSLADLKECMTALQLKKVPVPQHRMGSSDGTEPQSTYNMTLKQLQEKKGMWSYTVGRMTIDFEDQKPTCVSWDDFTFSPSSEVREVTSYYVGKISFISRSTSDLKTYQRTYAPTDFDVEYYPWYRVAKKLLDTDIATLFALNEQLGNRWDEPHESLYSSIEKYLDEHVSSIQIHDILDDLKAMSFDDHDGDLVCIQNEESTRTDENDGIHKCLALIERKKWQQIVDASKLLTDEESEVMWELSNGGWGAEVCFNIKKLVNTATIHENLSPDVIAFLRKVHDSYFLATICHEITERLEDREEKGLP